MDKMKIKIIKGGIIKVITDGEISPEEHQNAEEFLKYIARKMGGETISEKNTEAMLDVHTHQHKHEHQ